MARVDRCDQVTMQSAVFGATDSPDFGAKPLRLSNKNGDMRTMSRMTTRFRRLKTHERLVPRAPSSARKFLKPRTNFQWAELGLVLLLMAVEGCSGGSGDSPSVGNGGVNPGLGGASATGANGPFSGGGPSGGGAVATGGAEMGGGASSTGGSLATGGSKGTGGATPTGGSLATGGSNGNGGAVPTGGSLATGGSKVSGGAASTGGSTGLGGATTATGGRAAGGAATGGNPSCTPPTPPTAKDSVTVDMGAAQGAPTYRASGFIYGISQDGSQPPNATLTDIKIRYLRSGGAQIGCPNGGYVNGQYTARWNAVKAYYTKAKAIGATLLVLTHDIWGADAVCKVPRWPGQGGDWTEYTTFVNQLITDAKAAGMTGADVRWELWNEPDYSGFWGGTQAQWLEMWKRGYQLLRAGIPGVAIEGPSLASGVGGWFNAFLDYAKTNNVMPDYLGWHEAGGGGDPVGDTNAAKSALSSRSINVTNLDISEYGSTAEQNPGHSAWFLSRFERAGVDGLRSNWGGGSGLYSTMGGLVTGSWQPNGQWWIYKRYADQTGLHTNVTAGSQVDAVAYQDAATTKSIIIVGNKGGVTGSVNVVIKNLPAWLQGAGTAKVVLERMPNGTSAVTAPTVVSSTSAAVTCNALTVTIDWATAADGYTITLTPS